MVPVAVYLVVAAVLFAIGTIGVLTQYHYHVHVD
jgi:NADH:ubiquinone oxidoreductase subunit K